MLFLGIMIPFIGTSIGAGMVFFMRRHLSLVFEKILLGFAAGVMVAASIWSLILPSIDMAYEQGIIAWFPAALGFVVGIFGLVIIHHYVSFFNVFGNSADSKYKKVLMMILAVVLHNIPEGMAVGVGFALAISSSSTFGMVSAFSLAMGIAIQNFPEGAIISMPLRERGYGKWCSFGVGVLSGIIEPIFSFITILLTGFVMRLLPYLLSFAAGAMFYVVVCELVPEFNDDNNSCYGVVGFTVGFLFMMVLDVAFG